MEEFVRDYISLDTIFYKNEDNWNKLDKLIYDIINYNIRISFYSKYSEAFKKVMIEESIQALDDDEKILIEMIFYEGMTIRKCSKILGIPRTTLSRYVFGILQKMRKYLEGKYGNKIL